MTLGTTSVVTIGCSDGAAVGIRVVGPTVGAVETGDKVGSATGTLVGRAKGGNVGAMLGC